jgi:hypothetical protein
LLGKYKIGKRIRLAADCGFCVTEALPYAGHNETISPWHSLPSQPTARDSAASLAIRVELIEPSDRVWLPAVRVDHDELASRSSITRAAYYTYDLRFQKQ